MHSLRLLLKEVNGFLPKNIKNVKNISFFVLLIASGGDIIKLSVVRIIAHCRKTKTIGGNFMSFDFTNQVAIVTGASSGIGLLFCQEWARLGGKVAMCARSIDKLEAYAAELNEKYGNCALGVKCDVQNYEDICAARDATVEAFGRIDVLVNAAGGNAMRMRGISFSVEFPDVPIEVFDWGLDLNLKGPFYFGHAVLKQMREQKSGLIINVGSITGAEGTAASMDYATSKAGLMYGLTKSQARYGSKHGIRSVCISPGPVLTREAMSKMKTLMGRAGEVQEIIDLMLFVASDKGQFINGENIMIDGGRNAMGRA